ncbi:hypothetical protein ON010_g13624 [Phytophthora cinnamomi]|nr:hypothetical protein ON010_g13624 [Phytophthora cinnamomi]
MPVFVLHLQPRLDIPGHLLATARNVVTLGQDLAGSRSTGNGCGSSDADPAFPFPVCNVAVFTVIVCFTETPYCPVFSNSIGKLPHRLKTRNCGRQKVLHVLGAGEARGQPDVAHN